MKNLVGFILALFVSASALAQVDTTFIYNTTRPYGTLDIRIAEASNRFWYLQENVTVSFRQSSPGVKTNSYHDMTSWDSSPYKQGNMRKQSGTTDAFIMNYRLLFPVNYNPSYASGYPIIVMLHGLGERGNCWDNTCYWATKDWRPATNTPAAPTTVSHPLLNNDHNLSHGGSPHLTARNLAGATLPDDPSLNPRAFPGFVLFPQNLNGWDGNSSNDVIRLIRLVAKKYNVDPDRIYLHGLSNGGQGCYDVVKRAPWLFAAVLPMSAVNDAAVTSRGLTPTIAHIPFWTFQGGQDALPSPVTTSIYVKTFKEAGMDVRYSLYPNLGHGTWNTAYAEPDFFSWMLSKDKSNFHTFFNAPTVCTTNGQGAKFGFAAGFFAYQWSKDGVVIPGATSHEFIATEPGEYRGRFSRKPSPSESDWNEWSNPVNVTVNNPAQAVIDVTGTRLMRGPDNDPFYNTVHLKSNQTNDKYFWYKNGVLVNVPNTTLDDTTRTYSITSLYSGGNGKFTLITRSFDNCPTPPSDTVHLYFNYSSPTMAVVNTPTNFTGMATSPSSASFSWSSVSTIETGFEIWKRKPGDIFRLAGIAPANATNFVDSNLEPSTTYDFKIRAIADKAKSHYAPSNTLTTNLVITTGVDGIAPGPASDVVVTSNTISTISLRWTAAVDDIKIRRYIISYAGNNVTTPTAATSYTLTGLPMNTAYNITVTAEDFSGNVSSPTAPVVGTTYVTGLNYTHSTGAWTDLDQITNWGTPEFTGVVPNFTLAPRTQEDFFNFEFTGYLFIKTAGNYEFNIASDDGSRLSLNNAVIIDHDGLHGASKKYSPIQALTSGPKLLNVKYFEYTGGHALTVQYRGADTKSKWITIPATALKSGETPPTTTAASLAGEHYVIPELKVADDFVSLDVYPNPVSSDNITIRVATESTEPVDVNLIDIMGKSFYRNVFSQSEVQTGARITPASTLINGMYVVVVKQGKYTVKEKVIIKN